jgi:hypothetical protein
MLVPRRSQVLVRKPGLGPGAKDGCASPVVSTKNTSHTQLGNSMLTSAGVGDMLLLLLPMRSGDGAGMHVILDSGGVAHRA